MTTLRRFVVFLCVKICFCHLAATSYFDVQNIKGYIELVQDSPSRPTKITIALEGLASSQIPMSIRIAENPIDTAESTCLFAGPTFDPDGRAGNACSPSSDPLDCSIGDLTARHGFINTSTFVRSLQDNNVPLYGGRSVIGRAVVLTSNSGAQYCSNAMLSHGAGVVDLLASFTGSPNLSGTLRLVQVAHNSSGTTWVMLTDVAHTEQGAVATADHKVTINTNRVSPSNCSLAGNVLNPLNKSADSCAQPPFESQTECAVGDLTGRFGLFKIPATRHVAQVFPVNGVPLTGPAAVRSNLNSVLVSASGSAQPLTCATVRRPNCTGTEVVVTAKFDEISALSGLVSLRQSRPGCPTVLSVNFTTDGESDFLLSVVVTTFPSSSEPGPVFDPFPLEDRPALGDLSSRFGVQISPSRLVYTMVVDGLPLQGLAGVAGRSVSLVDSSGEVTMTSALLAPSEELSASFVGPLIFGSVVFFVAPPSKNVQVVGALSFPASGGSLTASLHLSSPCTSLLPVLNPSQASGVGCSPSQQRSCVLGDLSGKLGLASLAPGQNFFKVDTTGDLTVDLLAKSVLAVSVGGTLVCSSIVPIAMPSPSPSPVHQERGSSGLVFASLCAVLSLFGVWGIVGLLCRFLGIIAMNRYLYHKAMRGVVLFLSAIAITTTAVAKHYSDSQFNHAISGGFVRLILTANSLVWLSVLWIIAFQWWQKRPVNHNLGVLIDIVTSVLLFLGVVGATFSWNGAGNYCSFSYAHRPACRSWYSGVTFSWILFALLFARLAVHIVYSSPKPKHSPLASESEATRRVEVTGVFDYEHVPSVLAGQEIVAADF